MPKGEGHLGQQWFWLLHGSAWCSRLQGDISLKPFWGAPMSSTQSSWSVLMSWSTLGLLSPLLLWWRSPWEEICVHGHKTHASGHIVQDFPHQAALVASRNVHFIPPCLSLCQNTGACGSLARWRWLPALCLDMMVDMRLPPPGRAWAFWGHQTSRFSLSPCPASVFLAVA